MRYELLQRVHRLSLRVIAILLVAAGTTSTHAGSYRFGYSNSYYYPYGGYGIHDSLRLRQEMRQIGDQMQIQQRQIDEQVRQQQEQTLLLRQQQSTRMQVTAMQACYYRLNGSLDLCDRLFEAASKKHTACVDTAVEMNPACATESASPATESGS